MGRQRAHKGWQARHDGEEAFRDSVRGGGRAALPALRVVAALSAPAVSVVPPLRDVVVVGAGPGGLAAAYRAASLGLSVVVLERKKVVGYPVNCGEFAIAGTSIEVFLPDSRDLHS
ncbi:TPA: FAD-binding protein, partial [Candidatus Micrarchaeota archaeon]|nr:FAD-binding protein [Candidatus Micrarchaeota archaeon]